MPTSTSTILATTLWVKAIQSRLGGRSLGGIEKWVLEKTGNSKEDFWQDYSKRFYQYLKGVKSPSRSYRHQLERLLPGTSEIFDHPLWSIIENPLATSKDINDYMQNLEPNIYRRLFKHSKRSGIAERRQIRGIPYIGNIGKESSLDALAALLMLIREAEIKEDFITYTDAKWEVQDLLTRLAVFAPFSEISEDLNKLIDERFIRRIAPYPPMPQHPKTNEYPHLYHGPQSKPDIKHVAQKNGESLLRGLATGVLSVDEKKQMDYLFQLRQFTKRDPQEHKTARQVDCFTQELRSITSKLINDFRNCCAGLNSASDQEEWNMQLHALHVFARYSGFT